ncbi:MAG: cation transporter [Alphaproteobacteria bacterium]
MGACCDHQPDSTPPVAYKRVLWAALVINSGMFIIEIVAGLIGGSVSLQADALDFFADAANYGISLLVLSSGLRVRAQTAMAKGIVMGILGIWVLGLSVYHMAIGQVPGAVIMGGVGLLALTANVVTAWMLYHYRDGDSNMRSVWLCSRNDAIANIAVLVAAVGVWNTGTGWPDVAVGVIIAGLGLSAGAQIFRLARTEMLKSD